MIKTIISIIAATLLMVTVSYACPGTSCKCHLPKETVESKKEVKVQTTCPVMEGNKINKDLHVDVEGKRIYVCCKGCISKIKEDPKKYIKKLEDDGVVLEDSPHQNSEL